jgi:hypothetical protein
MKKKPIVVVAIIIMVIIIASLLCFFVIGGNKTDSDNPSTQDSDSSASQESESETETPQISKDNPKYTDASGKLIHQPWANDKMDGRWSNPSKDNATTNVDFWAGVIASKDDEYYVHPADESMKYRIKDLKDGTLVLPFVAYMAIPSKPIQQLTLQSVLKSRAGARIYTFDSETASLLNGDTATTRFFDDTRGTGTPKAYGYIVLDDFASRTLDSYGSYDNNNGLLLMLINGKNSNSTVSGSSAYLYNYNDKLVFVLP